MVDTRDTFSTQFPSMSPAVFFFFSIFFNAVNTIPPRAATHPRANDDEVAFDLPWTELYRKFDAQHFSLAKPSPWKVRRKGMKPPKFATGN